MKIIFTLFICLALCVTTSLTGCAKNGETFTPKSYTAPATQVSEICVDVRDRQIEVALSADDKIYIDYFESSKESYDISVSDAHVLTMTSASDKVWTDYIGAKVSADFRKISLRLPGALLAALKLSTTNENIALPALTVSGDISLSANGGSITFENLNVENSITLHAKNGDITGAIIGSYDDYLISCDSKKGESNLPSSKETGTKMLTVSNNNGKVAIDFVGK